MSTYHDIVHPPLNGEMANEVVFDRSITELKDNTDYLKAQEEANAADIANNSSRIDGIVGGGTTVENADKLDGLDSTAFVKRDGSLAMTNNLDIGGNRVLNVGHATADTDGINRGQLVEEINARTSADIALQDQINNISTGTTKAGDSDKLDGLDSTAFVKRDGSLAMTGDFNAGGHAILNVGVPAEGTESAIGLSTADQRWLKRDGSNEPSNNVSWGGHKIINLADPVDAQDAVTKAYVDGHTGSESDPLSIHKDGSNSPTANISWDGHRITDLANPVNPGDAVNKSYLAGQLPAPYVESDPLSIHLNGNNSPTADVSWGNHKITNLADPVNDQDAVTKAFLSSNGVSTFKYSAYIHQTSTDTTETFTMSPAATSKIVVIANLYLGTHNHSYTNPYVSGQTTMASYITSGNYWQYTGPIGLFSLWDGSVNLTMDIANLSTIQYKLRSGSYPESWFDLHVFWS